MIRIISWSISTFITRLEEVNKKKTRATTTRKLASHKLVAIEEIVNFLRYGRIKVVLGLLKYSLGAHQGETS